jgi:opacity protein-like surface antigen
MRRPELTFAMGCALLLASVVAARAADMPRDVPHLPAAEPVPVVSEYNPSGWYLRGDIGGSWAKTNGLDAGSLLFAETGRKAGSSVNAGIGFGVRSRWLRIDVTVDHTFASRFSGSVFAADDLSARVEATSALFNGYIDLGTWYGATPYIGAGAGAAFARVSDYQRPLVPFSGASTHMQTNFAYALMGGVAWTVAPNLQLDIGYRYLNMGDVKTASDALGYLTIRNVAAHQVRLGVRWGFDGL